MNKFLISLLVVLFSACAVTKSTKTMHPYSGDNIGCGDFIIYKLANNNKEYVSVIIDMSAIEVENLQAYAIGKADVVIVTRRKFDGPINSSLCNDVMSDKPEELLEEIATDGVVELLVNEAQQEEKKKGNPYKVTVVLKKVVFEGMTIDYLRMENVNVGWLPG
ncbi:hypothetical protein [Ekhidna sp.]|uniref:hypothetical protein n=1 Tax=Ekhidna sp. TaxID=2608089 RepID=UPI0032EDFA95